MSDNQSTKADILDRLKVYEEYGPLSSVAIHPETPGYSTGMLLGDTRAARAEIERLRRTILSALDCLHHDDSGTARKILAGGK